MYKNLREIGEAIVEGSRRAEEAFPGDENFDAFVAAQKSVENTVIIGLLVDIRDELYALNQRSAAQNIIKKAKEVKK